MRYVHITVHESIANIRFRSNVMASSGFLEIIFRTMRATKSYAAIARRYNAIQATSAMRSSFCDRPSFEQAVYSDTACFRFCGFTEFRTSSLCRHRPNGNIHLYDAQLLGIYSFKTPKYYVAFI